MSAQPKSPGSARPASPLVELGVGWIAPALLVALLVWLTYLPSHAQGAGAVDRLSATVAALFVLGLSIALVRFARGALLRAAGSTEPIALLGSGSDALLDARIAARWRLLAIAGGAIVATGAAAGAAVLGETVGPTSYAHALASLALIANLALAGGVLIPAPAFTGWALVLAAVDARGATPEVRVRRASRIAQALGIPTFAGLGLIAGLLGDPMLMLAGFGAVIVIRSGSRLAEGRDAVARVLANRLVGDLARPITSHAESDDSVAAVLSRMAGTPGVTAIESGGALVGAVGPRQLAEGRRDGRDRPISDLMVPVDDLTPLSATAPAATVLLAMARHGFAVVRGADGLAYVEAEDVLGQILTAGARGPISPPGPAKAR